MALRDSFANVVRAADVIEFALLDYMAMYYPRPETMISGGIKFQSMHARLIAEIEIAKDVREI